MQCRHIYNITNISTLITTNVILNQSIVLYCIAMAMAEQHQNIKQKLPLLKFYYMESNCTQWNYLDWKWNAKKVFHIYTSLAQRLTEYGPLPTCKRTPCFFQTPSKTYNCSDLQCSVCECSTIPTPLCYIYYIHRSMHIDCVMIRKRVQLLKCVVYCCWLNPNHPWLNPRIHYMHF